MRRRISRRGAILGAASAGTMVAAGALFREQLTLDPLYRAGEALSRRAHRLLLAHQPLAREFGVADISPDFPVIGTAMPEGERYRNLVASRFVNWRLAVGGEVERPLELSLAELQALPARTQITAHSCERGWTAIAQWTGVPLQALLALARPMPHAQWVIVYCADGWWDSYSLDAFEALHPQTILAYGMNGGPLPVPHGAPVRLRVERQLGWKSLKFVERIELVEDYRTIGKGNGSFVADEYRFQWYGGI